jgi:hypothetical protein
MKDLTKLNATEQLSDAELDQVAGGLLAEMIRYLNLRALSELSKIRSENGMTIALNLRA